MTNPDVTQKEKKEVLENGRRLRTYLAHAETSVDEERGGRYAAVRKPAIVVGVGPIRYPAQPEGSPWHSDPVPPERPLGYSMNDQECVGEFHERGDAAAPVRRRGFRRRI